MLGLVITMLAAMPASPAPSVTASITCPQGPASCDASADPIQPAPALTLRAHLASAGADRDAGPPQGYATPAVIDCRVPVVSPVLLTLVGECDGATQIASRAAAAVTLTDASYRASRYPESERPAGTLGPRRVDAREKAKITTCTGVPPEGGIAIAPSHHQPLALFALPDPPRHTSTTLSPPADRLPPSAPLHPLERPPRA